MIRASAAAERLQSAADWLQNRGAAERVLVLGASLEGAHEVCRAALTGGARSDKKSAGKTPLASFGWERATVARCAASWAAPRLAAKRLAPIGRLPLEAVCARVVHAMGGRGELGRFELMLERPGFARALARTFEQLRMAGFASGELGDVDLDRLLRRFEEELDESRLADRATVFREARLAFEEGSIATPALLAVDVVLGSTREIELVGALASRSKAVLAVVPAGDERSWAAFETALGGEKKKPEQKTIAATGPMALLQERLFSAETGAAKIESLESSSSFEVLSAPGESRECVEIVRRVRRAAEAGTPFDQMAVVLRAPAAYRAHLVEAFRRADVPVYFSRGSRKPDAAGRAFLALLACAAEGLSARRFAEYLSLGEVPDADGKGSPPAGSPRAEAYVPPDEELAPAVFERSAGGEGDEGAIDEDSDDITAPPPPITVAETAPVVAGTLRAPYRWERLLVEAAVIGGLDRWKRRLGGFEQELKLDLASLRDPEDPRAKRLEQTLIDLASLREYALPLLAELSALPREASWGEWIEKLAVLASRALRRPTRVLSLLAELDPMGKVGPVRLDEVRLRLEPRLTQLTVKPDARRFGKVFVAASDEVRGMAFDVVFVPALAERLFPQKIVEDPILLDARRRVLGRGLETNEDRAEAERLALRLAVGAAKKRVVLSYPRVDIEQARPRTPSFYALEVLRAVEGRLPGFSELARRAEQVGGARLGWPAPRLSAEAIDEAEHDLALLEGIFQKPEAEVVGMARYLLSANPHLSRALRFRGQRWVRKWSGADGFVDPRPQARAALAKHAMGQRSFSPTALQHFAACPYRFVLQALHRLAPREEPAPIEELDPLQRGSLLHEVEFELHIELRKDGLLPITPDKLDEADARLRKVVDRVAARYEEKLAPAIDRVFRDAVDSLTADAREMLRREAHDERWRPTHFELSFGLDVGRERDERSVDEPVKLANGLLLRGSIDLVEESAEGTVRATDYKTGKVRAKDGETVIGGGLTLQPVLYAMALERMFPDKLVEGGRLYYCTAQAGFHPVWVALDEQARAGADAVVSIITKALDEGFLPAAPAKGECTWCDYKVVCGPYEEVRTTKIKFQEQLKPLVQLRKRA